MPRIARSETVVPKEMSEEQRSALTDELFEVHGAIFGGVDRARTVSSVVSPPSDFTTILLHRSDEGKIVGFFAVHFYDRKLRGTPATIVRSIVGMLRAYRGQNVNIGWALRTLLTRKLARPERPFYGFGLMVHPSSFLQVSRYVDVFWPRPNEPVPLDMLDFMIELADEFKLPRIDPRHPLVRGGGVPTQETEAERDYWRGCEKPAARFYVSTNPTYAKGTGIVTLFPITASMLAGIATRMASEKAKLAVEGALATAQRLPLGALLLRPAEVRRRLQAAPLFATLDDASLERLVAGSEVVSLPGARSLFRAGDDGDDLYLVARGAVQIVAGRAGEEDILDQLGTGALFGEIAVLAGSRRSASVRTAIPSTLVRIPGAALRSLMQESAAVRDAIWGAFAARIVDDHLRASGRFPELDRTGRMAWIRRARHEDLEAGASVPVAGDALLVVLRGTAQIQQGATQISAQGPIVIEPGEAARITVKTAARVAHVPPIGG